MTEPRLRMCNRCHRDKPTEGGGFVTMLTGGKRPSRRWICARCVVAKRSAQRKEA